MYSTSQTWVLGWGCIWQVDRQTLTWSFHAAENSRTSVIPRWPSGCGYTILRCILVVGLPPSVMASYILHLLLDGNIHAAALDATLNIDCFDFSVSLLLSSCLSFKQISLSSRLYLYGYKCNGLGHGNIPYRAVVKLKRRLAHRPRFHHGPFSFRFHVNFTKDAMPLLLSYPLSSSNSCLAPSYSTQARPTCV